LFTKDDVLKALRLGHSQASSDANLFKGLGSKLDKVHAWMENPDGTEGKQFRDMSIQEFKQYKERKLSKNKGKKRVRTPVLTEEEVDVPKPRKGKEKAKAARVIDSDDLDASTSD
jgi:hypothetical protein